MEGKRERDEQIRGKNVIFSAGSVLHTHQIQFHFFSLIQFFFSLCCCRMEIIFYKNVLFIHQIISICQFYGAIKRFLSFVLLGNSTQRAVRKINKQLKNCFLALSYWWLERLDYRNRSDVHVVASSRMCVWVIFAWFRKC